MTLVVQQRFIFVLVLLSVLSCLTESAFSDDPEAIRNSSPTRNSSKAMVSLLRSDLQFAVDLVYRRFTALENDYAIFENAIKAAEQTINATGIKKGDFESRADRLVSYTQFCFNAASARRVLAVNEFANSFAGASELRSSLTLVLSRYVSALDRISVIAKDLPDELTLANMKQSLLTLRNIDQTLVDNFIRSNHSDLSQVEYKLLTGLLNIDRCGINIDSLNKVKEIVELNGGWPRRSQVQKEGEVAAFLVTHNTSHDLDFLEKVATELERLQKIGEVRNHHFPNLYDVIAYYEKRPQRFGWILRCREGAYRPVPALEDPDTVNERRAAYRLKPLQIEIDRKQKRRPCK